MRLDELRTVGCNWYTGAGLGIFCLSITLVQYSIPVTGTQHTCHARCTDLGWCSYRIQIRPQISVTLLPAAPHRYTQSPPNCCQLKACHTSVNWHVCGFQQYARLQQSIVLNTVLSSVDKQHSRHNSNALLQQRLHHCLPRTLPEQTLSPTLCHADLA